MRCLGVGICAFGLSLILPVVVVAADATFTCPAADAAPAIEMRFSGDTLEVVDPAGTASLSASLEGDVADMFGVTGFGEADQMVPDPADTDACLAAGLKSEGGSADDKDVVASLLAGCQVELAGKKLKLPVDLHVTATVIDPGTAMLFIQRTYQAASTVTGTPLTLDEWPTRDCTVTVP